MHSLGSFSRSHTNVESVTGTVVSVGVVRIRNAPAASLPDPVALTDAAARGAHDTTMVEMKTRTRRTDPSSHRPLGWNKSC